MYPRRAEYFARYNLGNDVPFVPYTNGIVSYTEISSASRGAIRPTWELLYNHYVIRKGMDAPWSTLFLNNSLDYYHGAEGGAGSWGEGSGHYDGLGWGSLLYHMDETDVAGLVSSRSTLPTASPMSSASSASTFAPRATTTTGVSDQSAHVSSSTTTYPSAVSSDLGTGNSALSTAAKNIATPISSMHSTASTSILTTSTTTPLGRPQEAHHHHHHHHHVDAQAQNVCHVH
jgi:hypothetical protein